MTKDIEEIASALDKSRIFISLSIYQYIPHIHIHPLDVGALGYYAKLLDITIPSHVGERIEESLFEEISHKHTKMPFREVLWGISYLLVAGHTLEELRDVIEYLLSFQNEDGGIGFYYGDVSRIPSTGWYVTAILSKKHENDGLLKAHENKIIKACNYVIDQWNSDVSIEFALSYKGAAVLTTLLRCVESNLKVHDPYENIKNTVKVLLDLQIENGSWTFLLKQSDSRISRALSASHMTSKAMIPLCEAYIKEKDGDIAVLGDELLEETRKALKRGAKYLCETQNELGFWYAHDPGELSLINGQNALALKGALEVLRR